MSQWQKENATKTF